jgi:hypothetical protein
VNYQLSGAGYRAGSAAEAKEMASKDRPHKEAKKKPKTKEAKPHLESLLQSPPPSVEVIKPKRKPRWEEPGSGEE